jgi:VWFA-related protein
MSAITYKVLISINICILLAPESLSLIQQQNSSDETIRLRIELVLLEADVLNKKTGQAVAGLKKEDFVLYEDGVKQEITHFSQNKLPLSVLILLDVSGSVLPSIKQLREGALESLQNLKPEDEIAVIIFAAKPKLLLPFTRDKQAAANSIRMANNQGVGGETDPNEAIYQAAAYLKSATNPQNRRVIIAISDDVSTHKALPLSKSKTTQELLESAGVICGLFFDSIYKKKAEPRVEEYGSVLQTVLIAGETDVIKSYVDTTGGIAIQADQQNVKEGFHSLIERLRTRYSFGYISSNSAQDSKFRKIKLKISPEVEKRKKGIGIITRKGYSTRQPDKSSVLQ